MLYGSYTTKINSGASLSPYLSVGPDYLSASVSAGNFSAWTILNRKIALESESIYKKDGTVVVVSGMVYNAWEIKKELGVSAHATYPEWVWHAFSKWGVDFVKKCNGDFVFCIYTAGEILYLFRDHLGVCPVAYCMKPEGLFFSGDEKALSRCLFPGQPIESDYLLSELKLTNSHITPNTNVMKLPAGHYLTFTRDRVKISPYWFPESIKTDKNINFSQAVDTLKSLVSDAVKIRCDKRFHAGTHLSGGLDSGLVSVLARENYTHQPQFLGFSYSPPPKEEIVSADAKDERLQVNSIAIQAGITPVFTDLTLNHYVRYAEDYYNNCGSIWEERICEAAAEKGINLLFSGWGGDEFLSKSYSGVYFDLLFGLQLKSLLRHTKPKGVMDLVKTTLLHIIFPAFGITWRRIGKRQKQISGYIKRPFRRTPSQVMHWFYNHTTRRSRHLKTLKSQYLAERCEKWYLLGLRYGISYRYPLLDYRIAEFILQLPSEHFIKQGLNRMLIREVSSGLLPEDVRISTSKFEEVGFKTWITRLSEFAHILIPQISEWEANPDMQFMDFSMLRKDAEKYLKQLPSKPEDSLPLLLNLQALKKMHEFTRVYRSSVVAGNASSKFSNAG